MNEPTIVVAGLARSGLSLTMQMLDAGGVPCQGEFPAYEPFPLGDIPWDKCHGTAVKLVDSHLHIPRPGRYWVIRLRRDTREQARSFNKWTSMLFGGRPIGIAKLTNSFTRDYRIIDEWALKQERLQIFDFEEVLKEPRWAATLLCRFLDRPLNTQAMAAAVVNRQPECYPGLLELELIKARPNGAHANG